MNWKQLIHESDDWVLGVVAAAAAIAILMLVRRFVLSRYASRTDRDHVMAGAIAVELVKRTRSMAAILVGSSAFFQFVTFTTKIENMLSRSLTLVFFLQLGSWGGGAIKVWIERILSEQISKDPAQATSFGLVSFAVRASFYVLLILLTLNNLGFNISALVAGLGVGGVAIALALQSILGDLFASLTIVLDKPFEVGDAIGFDTFSGKVEHIGLKTTRVRSTTGEELIIANSELLKARLKNFQRQTQRVITLQLGVDYKTKIEVLQQLPALIRAVIESQPGTTFGRCHLFQMGNSSLDYQIIYTVLSADYTVYMDVQQNILLNIYQQFQHYNIVIPYPTQTVQFVSAPDANGIPLGR